MDLGTFSVSLAVKDMAASRKFYEALGFEKIDGDETQNWLILRNGTTVIGLFHGMFEQNIMTFNPKDVRAIQRHLRSEGIALIEEVDEDGEGAGHITLVDPDGNPILFDQFPDDYTPLG